MLTKTKCERKTQSFYAYVIFVTQVADVTDTKLNKQ